MNESVMISLLGERLADHGAIFQLASTMHHKYIDFVTSNLNGAKNRVEDLVDTWCQVGTVFEGELLTVKTENQILLKQLDEQQTLLKELKNTSRLLLAQRINHCSSPNNDLNSENQEQQNEENEGEEVKKEAHENINNNVHNSSKNPNQGVHNDYKLEKMMMMTDCESSTSDNITKCIENRERISPNGGMKRVQLSDGIGDCGLSDGLLLTEDMHKLLAENLEIKLNDTSRPILNSIHHTNNSTNNSKNNSINNNNITSNNNNTSNNITSNNANNNIATSSILLIDSSENEESQQRNTSTDEFKLLNELLGSVTKNNGLSSNSKTSLPMLFHNDKVRDFENNGHSSNLDHEITKMHTSNNHNGLSSKNINSNTQLNNTTPNSLLTDLNTKNQNNASSSSPSTFTLASLTPGMKRARTTTSANQVWYGGQKSSLDTNISTTLANLTPSNIVSEQQVLSEARCDICMKQFAHRHSMIRHKKMIHLLTCPQPDCNRSFGTREELDRHEKTDHSKQCPFCGKQILKRLGLKTHLETCTKNPMKNRSQEISWALG